MNPINVQVFHSNLLQLYTNYAYISFHIWNVDENGCNGFNKVLARKDVRSIHAQIPNKREWLSVLTSINVAGRSIPHFFIFKGKMRLKDYIEFCGVGSTMAMQEKGFCQGHTC